MLDVLDRFLESARQIKKQRTLNKLQRPLEKATIKIFTAQRKAVIAALKRLREADSTDDLPLPGTAQMQAAIESAVGTALEAGAAMQATELRIALRFDLENARAIAYLDGYAAAQVTAINETTRDLLRTLIASNTDLSYTDLAKKITEAFQEFTPRRARLIAVTEVGNAYTEGTMIVARDLQDAGLTMEKQWLTSGDSKVSDGCLDNAAAGWIDLDEEFPSDDQRPLRFPGCRCDLLIRRRAK